MTGFARRIVGGETLIRLKSWFSLPPRAHGNVIEDRTVSFLELFYDLVYVAVVSQATHHLAEHISLRGVGEFAVIFGMIWLAWINGSLYLELHGREDGRTRLFVFLKMGILVLLAVFTADAAADGGPGFAIVYAGFLFVMAWLWYSVLRQDRKDGQANPQLLAEVGLNVKAMLISMAVLLISVFLPPEPRLIVWAGYTVLWCLGLLLLGHFGSSLGRDLVPTHSLVERFGLFTIVVLGEVVFGVVNGLSIAEQDLKTISTGMISLSIGFGFWWLYFDLIGRRLPRRSGQALISWILSHLPITLSIAAAGAAMISLIEHAHDSSTPEGTAWLLTGAVATGLISLVLAERALVDAERLSSVYQPLTAVLLLSAGVALIVGWAHPAPWLLASLIVAILLVPWFFAVSRFVRAHEWGEA